MITKVKQNFTSLIFNVLSNNLFSNMSKQRKYFIINILWLFINVKGRINFLQMARFSKFCEQYLRIGFQNTMDNRPVTSDECNGQIVHQVLQGDFYVVFFVVGKMQPTTGSIINDVHQLAVVTGNYSGFDKNFHFQVVEYNF